MASSSSCVVTASRLTGPERVITELNRGREIADSLRLMFDGSPESVSSARNMVNLILDTFTHSLDILRRSDDAVNSPAGDRSEDSGHSYKRPAAAAKDRRGCYKKKRSSETLIKETTNLVEDGHQWRKYGQKIILNAKHPRNYFRCTHKFDQGCQASKQVQKVKDDPVLYRTTYHGKHTCKKSAHPNHIIVDSIATDTPDSSVIWSFAPKPELQPPREYYVSPEMAIFDSSDLASFSPISCTESTRSVDEIVGSIEDFFEFGSLS